MKKSVLFFILFTASNFAQANSNAIKYGRDLCKNVSFRNSTERACEDWVIDNSDSSVYSIALNVCFTFNEGPLARESNCFTRASQWINNQDVKDQVELCEVRNRNYNLRAECLRDLFLKNVNPE